MRERRPEMEERRSASAISRHESVKRFSVIAIPLIIVAVPACLFSYSRRGDYPVSWKNLPGFTMERANCLMPINVGDQVIARVSSPSGAKGLEVGSKGFVRCLQPSEVTLEFALVCFAPWPGGHNNNVSCETCDAGCSGPSSSWWVKCSDIERQKPSTNSEVEPL